MNSKEFNFDIISALTCSEFANGNSFSNAMRSSIEIIISLSSTYRVVTNRCRNKMVEIKSKLYPLFILSLFHLSMSEFFRPVNTCTILKTFDKAGFLCFKSALDVMNRNLEQTLKKVMNHFLMTLSNRQSVFLADVIRTNDLVMELMCWEIDREQMVSADDLI